MGRVSSLNKQSSDSTIKGLLNHSTSNKKFVPEISNYKRKHNPTFLSNGIFKAMSNNIREKYKENRIQQSVNLDQLRKSRNFAGSFIPKNNFLEQSNNERACRSQLLRYNSSSIFNNNDKKINKNHQRNSTIERNNLSTDLSNLSYRTIKMNKLSYFG